MLRPDPPSFAYFWGKARPGPDGAIPFHPAWAHGLDVAAVGLALAEARPRPLREVADRLDFPPDALLALWLHLLALHDLGKFSPFFQAKADHYPPGLPKLGASAAGRFDPGHPKAGLLLLLHWLDEERADVPPLLRGWGRRHYGPLLQPIFGHHGRPVPHDPQRDDPVAYLYSPWAAAEAAFDYWRAVGELLPPPDLLPPRVTALKAVSWTLAGLTTLADWIGSSRAWFPYIPADTPLPDYWERARRQAETAVRMAGLAPAATAPRQSFAALTQLPFAPTEAQAWADRIGLADGPMLVLIEDVTGGGKTEAALMLTHRLIAAGRADGLYFALPTMATANAMFQRMEGMLPRLFRPESKPSLTLAHGKAWLAGAFRETAPGFEGALGACGDADEPDGAGTAPAWLASESRKALLADIGVGTIDQAILSVLPNRYGTVRLAGLAGKVLIVDEAHAYDAYVGRELERLVAFHAAGGGATIVLSATLPGHTKREILDTWRWAIGAPARDIASAAYPLATLAGPTSDLVEAPLVARADLSRTLTVTRLPSAADAIARILAAAASGAAVAWIRNSVDDAIEGAAALGEAGLASDLFHARFAMGDRLDIEQQVLARFGRRSTPECRRGRVVVATQVIEQSLDLDFDLVVTDLAPIDSLLQRAGRLWRHTHRKRPVIGPELAIVSPDPNGEVEAGWVRDVLPRAASVYRDHGIVWRTARDLFCRTSFSVPDDVRPIIEAVYSEEDGDIPRALQRVRIEAHGRASAERSIADQNLLVFADGYQPDGRGWQEERAVATRLAEDNRRIRLARLEDGQLVPWRFDPNPAVAWALSEVTAYERKLAGRHAVEEKWSKLVTEARSGWPSFEEDVLVLPLSRTTDDFYDGVLICRDKASLRLHYSAKSGLRFS